MGWDNLSTPGMAANKTLDSVWSQQYATERPKKKYEGVVVENRVHSDGNKIRVNITELLPFSKGHLKDNPIPLKRVYTDARGRTVTSRGTHNNNITCEYYSTDSFRKTPPDVQRGERVMVWQVGDTDYWYWEPIFHDSIKSRRLETVVQSVNADLPQGDDPQKATDGNTYYTEMSSHNKSYTISTSKANGELAAYKIQINAGQGAIVIQDDAGNHIELDTGSTKIWMQNAFKTVVELNKNNIKVHCNEDHETTIGRDCKLEVKGKVNVTIVGDTSIDCTGSVSLNCKSDVYAQVDGNLYSETGGTTTVKSGGACTIDSEQTNFTGSVSIAKGLSVSGASQMSGGGTVQGSLEVQGPVRLNGGTSSRVIEGSYR